MDKDHEDKTSEGVVQGLNNFVVDYQKNPFDYLYESDLQFGLSAHIRTAVNLVISMPIIPEHPDRIGVYSIVSLKS